jgi:hypothetical protein
MPHIAALDLWPKSYNSGVRQDMDGLSASSADNDVTMIFSNQQAKQKSLQMQ